MKRVSFSSLVVCAAVGGCVVLAVGCGGGGGNESATSVSGSFVGTVKGSDALVSVIATKPEASANDRAVSVYVCNSQEINEWLPGRADAKATKFVVTSDKGARAEVKLDGSNASGTITLASGKTLRFKAARATGIAGLYNTTSLADGRVSGTSNLGARLQGKVFTNKVVAYAHGQPHYATNITVTAPGGKPRRLPGLWYRSGSGAGRERAVVLPSGLSKGGAIRKGSNFFVICLFP
jgi:hypothetical protein